jgi:hypothetical protein
MEMELKARADARLAAAFEAADMADARGTLRDRLRELRNRAPEAFERARAHYESAVLPELADGASPLAAWIEYGRFLGQLDGAGRTVAIDGAGRGVVYAPPPAGGQMVLFMPDDSAHPALLLCAPRQPSPAQRAALALLIEARFTL